MYAPFCRKGDPCRLRMRPYIPCFPPPSQSQRNHQHSFISCSCSFPSSRAPPNIHLRGLFATSFSHRWPQSNERKVVEGEDWRRMLHLRSSSEYPKRCFRRDIDVLTDQENDNNLFYYYSFVSYI